MRTLRDLRAARSSRRFEASWSEVYDVLYGTEAVGSATAGVNAAFLAAQMAFLQQRLPPPPARVLDAGCGTGRHLLPLTRLGYRATGVDIAEAMLRRSREVLEANDLAAELVCADLRSLPFAGECVGGFAAALCLESPLAYLHQDVALTTGLHELRRVLPEGGRLMIDVFDYPATLGDGPFTPVVARFPTAWGSVTVRETHRHDRTGRLWRMEQAFTIEREGAVGTVETFTVEHALRIRTAAEYVAAVEDTGFAVEELLPAYPDTPTALRDERRLLLVAAAHGRGFRGK